MPQQRKHSKARNRHGRRLTGRVLAGGAISIIMVAALVTVFMATRDSSGQETGASANVPDGASSGWASTTYSGGPRLVVDQTEVDAGAVDYREPVEATYRLKNVGDEVVIIDQPSIKTLEGC